MIDTVAIESEIPVTDAAATDSVDSSNTTVDNENDWPKDHAYYTIERWKGKPNYCCRYCKFKTLNGKAIASDNLPVMISHFAAFHTSQPGAAESAKKSGLVGPNGRPL